MNNRRYTVELSYEQLRIISDALSDYSRVSRNIWHGILDRLAFDGHEDSCNLSSVRDDVKDAFKELCTPLLKGRTPTNSEEMAFRMHSDIDNVASPFLFMKDVFGEDFPIPNHNNSYEESEPPVIIIKEVQNG